MNKKVNTLLFVLGATLFNILIIIVCFIVLFYLYINIISGFMPESVNSWAFIVIFIGSLVISFVAYRYAIKFFLSKIDAEKYFDPLFVKKYRKK